MWPWGLTLAMTLTLNFQGQIWNLLYLNQKWSDCHETKSKHMDWTHGLKCDHGVWPWPWPWPWIFKVKHGICYISIKSYPKVRCKDVQDSDRGDFWCRRAVVSSSWSLRCSWSIACRRGSNYIFILNLTPGFNRLGKDNYKMRQKTFKFWDLVQLILGTLWYMKYAHSCVVICFVVAVLTVLVDLYDPFMHIL